MSRHEIPLLIATIVGITGIGWAVVVLFDSDVFAPSSAAFLAVGFVVFGILASVGIALIHAPWGRRIGFGVAAAGAGVAVSGGFGPIAVAALAVTFVAVVGLSGPWLRLWLRRRPSAEGPGPVPFALIVGLVGLVPLAGAAAPAGVGPAHVVLAAVAVASGLTYLRGRVVGLWGARLAVPAVGLWAAVVTPMPGGVVLLAGVAVVTSFAWRREPMRMVIPTPPAPAPRPPRTDPGPEAAR